MATNEKPSYLGLLNNISLAESCAGRGLKVWAEQTKDPRVRDVLTLVAGREEEHGVAFARRIEELGYALIERDVAGLNLAEAEAFLTSDRSDLEKLSTQTRLETADVRGALDRLLTAHEYDPDTKALMERYIGEEKDSGERLRALRAELEREANSG